MANEAAAQCPCVSYALFQSYNVRSKSLQLTQIQASYTCSGGTPSKSCAPSSHDGIVHACRAVNAAAGRACGVVPVTVHTAWINNWHIIEAKQSRPIHPPTQKSAVSARHPRTTRQQQENQHASHDTLHMLTRTGVAASPKACTSALPTMTPSAPHATI